MANPDLQLGGGGGGVAKKKFFSALRASFSSKHKGEVGPPGPSPGSTTEHPVMTTELNKIKTKIVTKVAPQ